MISWIPKQTDNKTQFERILNKNEIFSNSCQVFKPKIFLNIHKTWFYMNCEILSQTHSRSTLWDLVSHFSHNLMKNLIKFYYG